MEEPPASVAEHLLSAQKVLGLRPAFQGRQTDRVIDDGETLFPPETPESCCQTEETVEAASSVPSCLVDFPDRHRVEFGSFWGGKAVMMTWVPALAT